MAFARILDPIQHAAEYTSKNNFLAKPAIPPRFGKVVPKTISLPLISLSLPASFRLSKYLSNSAEASAARFYLRNIST